VGCQFQASAVCIDLQLGQERDGMQKLAITSVFTAAEAATIETLNPTLQGKTAKQQNPHSPSTLARASWEVARLGGCNCYGTPPGPITMHRGMERFNAIHEGALLRAVLQ
jgi:hypothetical protein